MEQTIEAGKTYKVNRANLITVESIEGNVIVCTDGQRLMDTNSFVEHIDWDTPA